MSESLLNRTYTPPTEGTFDPLTAGITGTLPSFYSYRPATPAPAPTPPASTAGGAVAGGGGGDSGGGIGSTPEGGLTGLGPNPGNLGSPGSLGNITSGRLGDISLADVARGAQLGGFLGGPFGAIAGGLIGGYRSMSDSRDARDTARAQAQVHENLLSNYLSDWEASSPSLSDFSDPASQAISNEISEAISAGFGPESAGYGGGDFGAPSSEASTSGGDMGGGAPGDSGDGYKQGGLVELQGGGKVAVGPGGGLDDLIPTSIEGRRAAALSDGEFVIPADVVSMMGDGSSNAGARRLYDLVRQVRDTKTGTTRQAGPLPVGDILKRSMS
jgi:hypothetical protein